MTITLRDVAREAGVSASAVSRSFSNGTPVSPETRARVLKVAARMGYRPNRLAASLTTGRTRLVGLVADDFSNPFMLRVIDLFTRGLQTRGLRPLLISIDPAITGAEALRMLSEYAVDAAILISGTLPMNFTRHFHQSGLPVVHAFARTSAAPDGAQAGINDSLIGRAAAHALIDHGYRNLAFIGGPEKSLPSRSRFIGFNHIVGKQGIPVSATHASEWSHAAGRAAMQARLAEGPLDGCFCADDVIALGAISALRDAGLRVPQDVGVIGVNDIEIAGWEEVNLTTIALPVAEIVAACIGQTEALITDPATLPAAQVFAGEVILRGTLLARPA